MLRFLRAEFQPASMPCICDSGKSAPLFFNIVVAIGVAARLSHHDPDGVFDAIHPLLTDRQLRTARAAGEALVQMKHPKAAEAITAALGTERAEEIAWQAGQWLKALRPK